MPKQRLWDIQQRRDHSCSSDKEEAKNMEPGVFTAFLVSVTEAACEHESHP